jgi:hypothetical protein
LEGDDGRLHFRSKLAVDIARIEAVRFQGALDALNDQRVHVLRVNGEDARRAREVRRGRVEPVIR